MFSKIGGGGGGGGPSPSQDDASRNHEIDPSIHGQPSLVLGGSLLSPGPIEMADLQVYPKDKFGNHLQTFDPSQLVVRYQQVNLQGIPNSWQGISVTWTTILNGYQAQVGRPVVSCLMEVQYQGDPALESSFQYTNQPDPSIFVLQESLLDCPSTISCMSQGLIVFTPKDQYFQPRLGLHASPPLQIKFVNLSVNGRPPVYDADKGFAIRNDCLLLAFSLIEPGDYQITLTDAQGSLGPMTIHGFNAIDPDQCVAYGAGLCSGKVGEQVSLFVALVDQNGSSYTPTANEQLDVLIVLSVPSQNDVVLSWSCSADVITAFYTRPATVCTYSLFVSVNHGLITDEAIQVEAMNDAPLVAVGGSECRFWSFTESPKFQGTHFACRYVFSNVVLPFDRFSLGESHFKGFFLENRCLIIRRLPKTPNAYFLWTIVTKSPVR